MGLKPRLYTSDSELGGRKKSGALMTEGAKPGRLQCLITHVQLRNFLVIDISAYSPGQYVIPPVPLAWELQGKWDISANCEKAEQSDLVMSTDKPCIEASFKPHTPQR